MEDNLLLRWNDYETSLTRSLRDIRDDCELYDVVVTCSDMKTLLAHRLVLSACSDVFRLMLRQPGNRVSSAGPSSVYLRGVTSHDFSAILEFIYNGEVYVSQADLDSFIAVAEDLQVKGLSHAADSSYYGEGSAKSGRRRHAHSEKPPKPAKKIRNDNGDSMGSESSRGDAADMNIKAEPEGGIDLESAHHSSMDEGHHDDPSDRSGYFDDDYRYGDFEEGTSDSKEPWWTVFERPGEENLEKGRRTERTFVHGGHAYIVNNKKGPIVYLRCRSYRLKGTSHYCYGRAILNLNNRKVVLKREHMCGCTAEELESEKRRKNSVYIYLP